MVKESQDIKVLKIVAKRKNLKTYQVMREGLDVFVSDAHRCLRRLAEIGFVFGERAEGKSYKQWNITPKGREHLSNYKNKK